jgi:hypothetical protein
MDLERKVLRLKREVAANMITANPVFRGVFNQMRQASVGTSEQAKLAVDEANRLLPAIDSATPVVSPPALNFNPKLSPISKQWDLNGPMAWRYLEVLVDCANAGQLDRFRECPACGNWFYATLKAQRCCSIKCRQKLHARSPEFKERRREYMRNLRASARERDERAEQLAKEAKKRRTR